MFRCRNNTQGLCVICVGIGIMLSTVLTRFTLFCGIVILAAGIYLVIKG